MHDGSAHDLAKSNNRMICSITWGVPAIVSDTPEYRRTAEAAGVPEAIIKDEGAIAGVVDGLRTAAARARHLDRAQPVIWRDYGPETIAKRFLALVADTTAAPPRQRGLFAAVADLVRGF
jgi:hypothetical protein